MNNSKRLVFSYLIILLVLSTAVLAFADAPVQSNSSANRPLLQATATNTPRSQPPTPTANLTATFVFNQTATSAAQTASAQTATAIAQTATAAAQTAVAATNTTIALRLTQTAQARATGTALAAAQTAVAATQTALAQPTATSITAATAEPTQVPATITPLISGSTAALTLLFATTATPTPLPSSALPTTGGESSLFWLLAGIIAIALVFGSRYLRQSAH